VHSIKLRPLGEQNQSKDISLYDRMKMAKGAALGMNWLHGICNITHRDLKPANLLVRIWEAAAQFVLTALCRLRKMEQSKWQTLGLGNTSSRAQRSKEGQKELLFGTTYLNYIGISQQGLIWHLGWPPRSWVDRKQTKSVMCTALGSFCGYSWLLCFT